MNFLKRHLAFFLVCSLGTLFLPAISATAQDPQNQNQNQTSALMRGYRTGYSDGYQAGVSDLANNAARDFRSKPEYQHADRAYNSTYGIVEDYRDGYQQGFEVGYNAAYDRRAFDSSIPADLRRKSDESTVVSPTDPNQSVGSASPSGNTVGMMYSSLRAATRCTSSSM